ncbi:MAG: hypothetical protein JSW13_01885 [Candidatus Aerophobus sp.]|nr:MAG: hypothetical protein JSW13_01885 [Candidatus Aerophobus sp.]
MPKNKSGVYVLSSAKASENIYYVGQGNLQEYLIRHLEAEENACLKEAFKKLCYLKFVVIEEESDRKGAERFLYDKLKPRCNQKTPEGPAIQINLP